MATFLPRPSGWQAQVRRRGRAPIIQTFRTKADACAWAAEVESQIARGVYRERSQDHRHCLASLLERYRIEITPHKKSAASEAQRIGSLLQDPLVRIRLSDLQPRDLGHWRDRRLTRVSGSTVNRELNLLSHVINVARKEWGVAMENPVSRIRRPKNNRARTRRLSIGEESALFAALVPSQRAPDGTYLPGGCRNPLMLPLVRLALETALRRSELLALTWADVYLDEAYLRLHDSKNGDAREVPLSSVARNVLASLPSERTGAVFPLSTEAVKQSFERACHRAGLVDFHFHDLRHEATSRIARKLDNVLELSAVTGHRTLVMLKRYYHPRASELAGKLG